jgi:hypothetical protein
MVQSRFIAEPRAAKEDPVSLGETVIVLNICTRPLLREQRVVGQRMSDR